MYLDKITPERIPSLTRLINAQIALVPPYWTLTESQVATILQKPTLWEIHYADEPPPRDKVTTQTIGVVRAKQVLAAMRFDQVYQNGSPQMASARWLVGDPQYPEAIERLLGYLSTKSTGRAQPVYVHGRTDFGIGWSGVPTTDTFVTQALTQFGFIPFQKWSLMTADISPYAANLSPLGSVEPLRLEHDFNPLQLEWNVNIYDGETRVGECQSWGIPSEFALCPDSHRWMQIEWLSVEEPYRRRGLARRMMNEQLRYHALSGKRYCQLYTAADNVATQALNASLGFTTQAELWGWIFARE